MHADKVESFNRGNLSLLDGRGMADAFTSGMMSYFMKCPVCGKSMHRVKVLPRQLSQVTRFICACGHHEDLRQAAKSLSGISGLAQMAHALHGAS
jgi:hypothetical protein